MRVKNVLYQSVNVLVALAIILVTVPVGGVIAQDPVEFDLTMAVAPIGGGTTVPAVGVQPYTEGSVVDITATAATGYKFKNWTGVVANSSLAETTVLMDMNKTVTANFDLTITIAAIPGVTPPTTGQTPVTAITPTAEYTGSVEWDPNHTTFAAETSYTATIRLTAKAGYTLEGVAANFFTVAGATSSNSANSGVVTAVFPETPVALYNYYETAINTALNVAAPGVLGNDSGGTDASLTAKLESVSGLAGNLTLNPNGSFVFTPFTNITGTTSFTYRACDGLVCSAPATVEIAIKTIPVAAADQYSTSVNTVLTVSAPGVLANDSGGGELTAKLVSGLSPGTGSLVLNAVGSFTYTPPTATFTGIASFEYTACDGTICSEPATVTIEVRAVPIAKDDFYDLPMGVTLNVPAAQGVLANDTAPGGATLTAEQLTPLNPSMGTLNFNANGGFSFTPTTGWSGITTFTYRACYSGICSEPATVTIAVKTVPTAGADSYKMGFSTVLNVAAPGVLGNDSGGVGAVLEAKFISGPTFGTLSNFNANGSFQYKPPSTSWTGTASFTYKACDGTVCSAQTTVTIIVSPSCLVVTPGSLEKTLLPNTTGTLGLLLTNTCDNGVAFNLNREYHLMEDFESGRMPPHGGWQTFHRGDTYWNWIIVDATINNPAWVDEGRYAAWANFDKDHLSDEWLLTPVMDARNLTDLVLSFRAYSNTAKTGATMKVWVTNAAGVPITTFSTQPLWDLVRDKNWATLAYRSVEVDLGDFDRYNGEIRIAWQYVGQDGQSFGLDEVDISYRSTGTWLSTNLPAGTVTAKGTQNIVVGFNSSGLVNGDYFAVIDVVNAPFPVINVLVKLRVGSVGGKYYLPLILR